MVNRMSNRSGQALIFIIMILVILAFVALWNFDLHKIIYVKSLSQNAGDAAALAGARWQATSLNLIGDLNVMQAVALTRGDTNEAAAISELQARLCYVGPMIGLEAAQQAGKNNGLFNNDRFTARLIKHADTVMTDYRATGPDGRMLFQEPFPGCWTEYAQMIQAVAANGVAVGPDNARYYSDFAGGSLLLIPDFYDAVAGTDWCWFYHHAYDFFKTYIDYQSWPPLPEIIPTPEPLNCEYFGLGLRRLDLIGDARALPAMDSLRVERGLSPDPLSPTLGSVMSAWYCYDESLWGPWDSISPAGENNFPATGPVKSHYDYAGGDAVTRVMASSPRLTPGAGTSKITWTAAAKPFGYLEVGGSQIKPNEYGLVLPAFREVRLIPTDASSAPAGGSFNLDWRDHIEEHLDDYLATGATVPGCYYCMALLVWGNPVFRQTGIDWLEENKGSCQTYGGGGRRGGGSRRGH
jgi:hypothetical protein